jgi:hypothetical protein
MITDVVTNATGVAIGTGQANTAAILLADITNQGVAAALTSFLGNDWWLPSQDELKAILPNAYAGLIPGFDSSGYGWGPPNRPYWSSTETGVTTVFGTTLDMDSEGPRDKQFIIYWFGVKSF